MKLIDYNNSSSLVIDDIKKVGNRVYFSIAVYLLDKRTDTNIRFETESFVEIDEWQQKGETLLSEHKLELENFSFHANHKVYEVELKKIENIQNFFELSSNIHNNSLKFVIESSYSFERMLVDEISKAIESRPSFGFVASTSCSTDGVTHVEFKLIKAYTDGRCVLQLKVISDNFRIVRKLDDWTDEARWISEQIQQFNDEKKELIEIVGLFIEMEFKWIDGRKWGKGSILDFSSPGPNELTFDDCVEVKMESVDWDNLSLTPAVYIPASDFKP